MLNLLLIIVGICIVYFIVRKAHVIATAIFFGAIILMLAVTVLRDQLHLPVNDYVDTAKIDELRDSVVPIEINNNQSETVVIIPKEESTDAKTDEVEEDIPSYKDASEEELQAAIDRLNGKETEIPNVPKEEVKEAVQKDVTDEKPKSVENANKEEQTLYSYPYEKLTTEYRQGIIKELKDKIKDTRFDNKLLGMNLYVDVKYDLGNAIMYNDYKSESLVIKFK